MNKAPNLRVISGASPEKIKADKIERHTNLARAELDNAIDLAKNLTPKTAWMLVFTISEIVADVSRVLKAETGGGANE